LDSYQQRYVCSTAYAHLFLSRQYSKYIFNTMPGLGRSQIFTSTWLHGWHLALPCVLMAKMTILTTNRAHSLEQMGNGLARRGMGDNHARHKGAGCQ
jgi:hypothetical protein